MRKIFLALTVTALIIAGTSCAFAYDEARDAMITYSGTDAFTRLLPEERQACMYWVSEGGRMSETCRSAVVRLISEDPEAVTPSQRRALLAAASDKVSTSTTQSPAPSEKPKTVEKYDNTGAIIAAGVIGVVAGMVIHNNLPRDRETHHHHHHVPPPPRRHRYPAPHRVPHHHRY